MPIYMKIKGLDGSVTAEGYEKMISLSSAEFEVTREMQQGVGRGRNRSWTAPLVEKIVCNKLVEDASGKMFAWSLGARPAEDEVIIHFVKLGDEEWVPYMKWTLYNVILASLTVNVDDSPEEKGTEDFSLSYLRIKTEFFETSEDEKVGAPIPHIYDITKGKSE